MSSDSFNPNGPKPTGSSGTFQAVTTPHFLRADGVLETTLQGKLDAASLQNVSNTLLFFLNKTAFIGVWYLRATGVKGYSPDALDEMHKLVSFASVKKVERIFVLTAPPPSDLSLLAATVNMSHPLKLEPHKTAERIEEEIESHKRARSR